MLPEGVNDVADKVKMRKGIDEIRVYNECAGFTVPVKRAFRQETDVTSSTLNTRIAPYWLATRYQSACEKISR